MRVVSAVLFPSQFLNLKNKKWVVVEPFLIQFFGFFLVDLNIKLSNLRYDKRYFGLITFDNALT